MDQLERAKWQNPQPTPSLSFSLARLLSFSFLPLPFVQLGKKSIDSNGDPSSYTLRRPIFRWSRNAETQGGKAPDAAVSRSCVRPWASHGFAFDLAGGGSIQARILHSQPSQVMASLIHSVVIRDSLESWPN